MFVRYIGPIAAKTGYAQAAHDYLCALKAADVQVCAIPYLDVDTADLDVRYDHLVEDIWRDPFIASHHVVHTIPRYAHIFAEGKYAPIEAGCKKICITTWETDKLPADAVESLQRAFDLIIVPCRFCRDVFERSGISPAKLAIVPHAYDPGFMQRAKDLRWTTDWSPPRPFVFYTVGVAGARKNLIGTLLAYWTAFAGRKDDVLLRVVTPYVPIEVDSLVARMGLPELAPVEWIQKRLTDAELRVLHQGSHCYISATRGEAWGLGAFEAAQTGNLVVMPDFGGQVDFLRYAHHVIVPCQLTPAVADEEQLAEVRIGGMTVKTKGTNAPIGIDATQNWAEPDIVEMAGILRRAYAGVPRAGAPWPNQPFTYKEVGGELRRLFANLEKTNVT